MPIFCRVYGLWSWTKSVFRGYGKAGIPILYIESDYSTSQSGQLNTRIEGIYIESLKTRRRQKMNYFVGIDIGSTSIKIVVVDENKNLVGYKTSASGSMFYKYAQETLELLLKELNIDIQSIVYVVSTGYGRKLYKEQMKKYKWNYSKCHLEQLGLLVNLEKLKLL